MKNKKTLLLTNRAQCDGEKACRRLSEKAKNFLRGTDMIKVYEYVNDKAYLEAYEKYSQEWDELDEAGKDTRCLDEPIKSEFLVYAVTYYGGEPEYDLSFDDLEKYLEDMADEMEEE